MSANFFSYSNLLIMILAVFLFFGVIRASQIGDCCCDTETVRAVNQEFLNEILTVIRKRTFFRIFKVDIYKSCKLWQDNPLCFKPTCAVQECCEDDIPQKWRDIEFNDITVGVDLFLNMDSFAQWNNIDEDQWVSYSGNQDQMIYIDLERNLDGYTGYKGEEASKIWKAIYSATSYLYNNIDNNQIYSIETEERVLYRLISGFHTLTTIMVISRMPLKNNQYQFGANSELYLKILHPHPEWIDNLYFDFVFLLRAINKASDIIKNYDYTTGNPADDAMTMGLINYLLSTQFIVEQCNHLNSFDESTMFRNQNSERVMSNFRNVFRNISDIIDCVGCSKCKLHAKLELLGLGTALKILFTKDILTVDLFERNEILSLIVTLGKYSDAIQFVEDMEQQIELNKLKKNIHGYVDIDNTKQLNQSFNQQFDLLINSSFIELFKLNKYCQQWESFCDNSEMKNEPLANENNEKKIITKNICDLRLKNCL